MAKKIWKIDIAKSLGGPSLADGWKNTHYVALDAAISDDVIEETVNWLVGAEREAHYDVVQFVQAHVVQVAENAINRPDHDFRTIGLDGTGERNTENALFPDARVLPLENVLVIQRSCNRGRAGYLYLRGALLNSDVQIGSNNKYVFTESWLADFATSGVQLMLNKLNNEGLGLGSIPEGAELIMPDKVDTIMEQFAQQYRTITDHSVKGISTRQRTVKRVPSETQIAYAANQRLHDLGRQLKEINLGGVAATALGAAQVLKIGLEAKELIEAVPTHKYHMLKVPPIVKALPALA